MPNEIAPVYARVFENHHEGRVIFDDLVTRFSRSVWVKGGLEAQRETDKRIGHREVIDYILMRINQAHGVQDVQDE